jgi:hypothetical protein
MEKLKNDKNIIPSWKNPPKWHIMCTKNVLRSKIHFPRILQHLFYIHRVELSQQQRAGKSPENLVSPCQMRRLHKTTQACFCPAVFRPIGRPGRCHMRRESFPIADCTCERVSNSISHPRCFRSRMEVVYTAPICSVTLHPSLGEKSSDLVALAHKWAHISSGSQHSGFISGSQSARQVSAKCAHNLHERKFAVVRKNA